MPDIRAHIILVNYRSIDNIRARFESGVLDGCDVVVVDNASDPDEVGQLCADYGATALLLEKNTGFAGGVNSACEVLRSRLKAPLLLLNPDVTLDRESFDRLRTHLQTTGATGVAPVLVEPSGRIQVGAGGGKLSLWSVSVYFLFISHVLPQFTGVFLTRRQALISREVDWLCMACLLLIPDAFDRFGAVPETELVYAEDVAWGTAAAAAGATFILASDVVVTHAHGSSGASEAWSGAMERLIRRRLSPGRARLAVSALKCGLALRQKARAQSSASDRTTR